MFGSSCIGWYRCALVAAVVLFTIHAGAYAGPYSPGKGGVDEAAFIDAGIAGFVGPAGEGITATDTNGNYINPVFTAWATGVVDYTPSDQTTFYGQDGIGPQFADPTRVLGAVTGNNFDIVSLGDMTTAELDDYFNDAADHYNPGSITLSFDQAITNGAGADFAVFENGFVSNYTTGAGSVSGQMFAEIGFVEVSTDGVNFARFPSSYLNYPLGEGLPSNTSYLTQDVSNLYNLAGKHANAYGESWGTPFNLDDLLDDQLVIDGIVLLNEINFVRIVDIPGDGSFTDAAGNSIFDAWATWGSGGMDLDAIGVINAVVAVPEPASIVAILIGATMITHRREHR